MRSQRLQEFVDRLRRRSWYGAAEYYLQPARKTSLGGAFNGQVFRRKIFQELVQTVGFDAVVECGTFRGETTGYLHQISGAPVTAIEADARFFGYSRTRHAKNAAVQVLHNDSRQALREFVARPDAASKKTFVYLDAHWHDDLPLREEVEILFNRELPVVAMVDDFQTPGDNGYGYDDYGPGKALTPEYLDAISVEGVRRFYPTERSENETGNRRGCVVLAAGPYAEKIAAHCRTLSDSVIHSCEAA